MSENIQQDVVEPKEEEAPPQDEGRGPGKSDTDGRGPGRSDTEGRGPG